MDGRSQTTILTSFSIDNILDRREKENEQISKQSNVTDIHGLDLRVGAALSGCEGRLSSPDRGREEGDFSDGDSSVLTDPSSPATYCDSNKDLDLSVVSDSDGDNDDDDMAVDGNVDNSLTGTYLSLLIISALFGIWINIEKIFSSLIFVLLIICVSLSELCQKNFLILSKQPRS